VRKVQVRIPEVSVKRGGPGRFFARESPPATANANHNFTTPAGAAHMPAAHGGGVKQERKRTIYRPAPLAPSRLINSPQRGGAPGGSEEHAVPLSPPHFDKWVKAGREEGASAGDIAEEIEATEEEGVGESALTDNLCALYGVDLASLHDLDLLPRANEPGPRKLTLPPCGQAMAAASPAPAHVQRTPQDGLGSERRDRSSVRGARRASSQTPSRQRAGDVVDTDRRSALGGMRYACIVCLVFCACARPMPVRLPP
jgi:hypothetical protein